MDEEYNPEFLSVSDDDGSEYVFEILDRIELDNGKKYIAVIPSDNADEEGNPEAGIEMIVLEVTEEAEDSFLSQIEDDDLYDEIEGIFIERLSEFYDIDVGEEDIDDSFDEG